MQIEINVDQLEASLFFTAVKDVRYYLKGVHVESVDGVTRLVSTDGAVASVQVRPGVESDNLPETFRIPNEDAVDMVKRAKKIGIKQLTLRQIEGCADRWEVPGLNLLFKQCDGVFPDYRRIVPTQVSNQAAQYSVELLVKFAKAAKALGKKDGSIHLDQNGYDGPAVVQIPNCPDFIGIIMPLRILKWTPVPVQAHTARFR